MESIVARCARIGRGDTLAVLLLATLGSSVASLPATADDLDVYRSRIEAQQKPNILFVLDYSGSMNRDPAGNNPPADDAEARIDILKDAVESVLDANLDTINAGIGSMYNAWPSGVRWPISDLRGDPSDLDPAIQPDTLTNRDIILKQLDRMNSTGSTATVNALAEAALYFRGGRVANGDQNPLQSDRHTPDVWDREREEYRGGNARAALPITYLPQDAYKTDQPLGQQFGYCDDFTPFGGTVNNCAPFEPNLVFDCETLSNANFVNEGQSTTRGQVRRCKFQSTDRWDGANYISPITNECAANAILLVSDGVPTRLNDSEAISDVLGSSASSCEDLSNSIFADNNTTDRDGNCGPEIAAHLNSTPQIAGNPGSTVQTYTLGFAIDGAGAKYLERIAKVGNGETKIANDLDELSEALADLVENIKDQSESFVELAIDVDRASFSSDDRAYFNLFTPQIGGTWEGNTKGYFMTRDGLKDLNGNDAVNAAGTGFANDIQSFWSDAPDGDRVNEGGISEQQSAPATSRKLYTALGYTQGRVDLAANERNFVRGANTEINETVLGLGNGSDLRDQALDWIQTAPMGDPLHTQPVTVDYGTRKVLYTMTNQGFLHAVDVTRPTNSGNGDTSGGEEIFAFMPERLLSNMPALMKNADSFDHIYGMDGGITRIHEDTDRDGIVDEDESMTLVLGMRRGGDSYYALDVRIPESPALIWSMDPTKANLGALGETWSKMAVVNGRTGDGNEKFLIFSGGYDAATLDDTAAPTATTRGNAIYVADTNGTIVWSVDGSTEDDMKYAIAADPTIIDSDGDGYADRLYVGDLGGQVWRVDFDNMRRAADYKVTRLAALSVGDHQPFFYAPSVSLIQDGASRQLYIALGSGDRTDPMNTTSENRIWVIKDTHVDKGAPATTGVITADMLYPVGSDNATAAEAQSDLATASGWRLDLAEGEKSLSGLTTFEGTLLATTFEPVIGEPGSCGVDPIGRYYKMNIATGEPDSFAISEDGTTNNQRFEEIPSTGIPSKPVVVFLQEGMPQVYVGLNNVGEVETQLSRVYWHAR